jgi:uncharacterized protein YuzE
MKINYDKKADAIYISFNDEPYSYGKDLDDERRVDYDTNGNPIGIELTCVSDGVFTEELPHRLEVERLLGNEGIKIYA